MIVQVLFTAPNNPKSLYFPARTSGQDHPNLVVHEFGIRIQTFPLLMSHIFLHHHLSIWLPKISLELEALMDYIESWFESFEALLLGKQHIDTRPIPNLQILICNMSDQLLPFLQHYLLLNQFLNQFCNAIIVLIQLPLNHKLLLVHTMISHPWGKAFCLYLPLQASTSMIILWMSIKISARGMSMLQQNIWKRLWSHHKWYKSVSKIKKWFLFYSLQLTLSFGRLTLFDYEDPSFFVAT